LKYAGDKTAIQTSIAQLDQLWQVSGNSDPMVLSVLNNNAASQLKEYSNTFPDNVAILATDRYGATVAATSRPAVYNQAPQEWWQKAYNNGQGNTFIGQPEYDSSRAAYSISIAVPIYTPDTREVIGVLHATYRTGALAAALLSVQFGQNSDAYILLPNEQMLEGKGNYVATDKALLNYHNTLPRQTYGQVNLSAVNRLISEAVVSSSDPLNGRVVANLGWSVLVLRDSAQALQPVNTASQTTLLTSLVVLLLTVLFGVVVAQVLAAPITQLTGVTIKVASGDMTATAMIESQDEIGTLAQNFNRMIARLQELQSGLEQQVEERTAQLKAVNEVGRVASAILDPQQLVARVVHLISDQFGYYYAAIFVADERGEWATLNDATGEAGRVLRENKHRLRIGGNSMVGTAISTGKPRIAQDVGTERIRFENPLLPYTRSEIALPLIVGERVQGALDVQSTQPSAFGPQEIETLQSMAHQVAIAFENAHLFQEAQKRLEEMQAIQRQYVLESWKPLAGSENLEYKIGDEDVRAGASEVDVPLALRDEIIGQISLTTEADWTPEQRNLIEAVATQAALALENARLVEESQSSAARERLLAEITGKVWASTTIDGILQTAVRELGRALDASEASIELKVDHDNG
jgi:GAF domain-containing protein/HAMP domain-containing protein